MNATDDRIGGAQPGELETHTADDEAQAARLRVEVEDLRAVVDLEVTRALTGMVPSRYLPPLAELVRRRELRPLPDDHPLTQRRPWSAVDLGEPFHQPSRGGGGRG